MRIVSIIEQREVIERILRHLRMWPPPKRPPKPRRQRAAPEWHPQPTRPRRLHDEHSQETSWHEEDLSQAPPGWDSEH